jgi:adenylate kinase family enzyme
MKSGVIVTGVPASGKTTIARALAEALGFAFLDKDDFLEDLYDKFDVQTWDDRTRLSRQSDQSFQDAAKLSGSAVLVSHWRSLCSTDESGTPSDWLADEFERLVEVSCICTPSVAVARFLERTRHPGHMDSQSDVNELEMRMSLWAARFPLGLGALIEVNTQQTVDTIALSRRIQAILDRN